MKPITRWLTVGTGLLLLTVQGYLSADDPGKTKQAPMSDVTLPAPSEVQALSVQPTTITLVGSDDARQLVLTGQLSGGRVQDLSGDAKYEVGDGKIAGITSSGRVYPLGNGSTTITARFGERTVTIPVKAESQDVDLPINFANQVVPIFTKLGCNSGGCHGKSGGQNGFALSLLGFVPELDYQTLVKEARGRRVFPASPDNSLLLLKATGTMAHAGGKRMEVGADEYKLIRRWIASGTPFGNPSDPVVTKITIQPEHRILTRSNRQQFAVQAHYSDGSVLDVTQRAQYESNDGEIAV